MNDLGVFGFDIGVGIADSTVRPLAADPRERYVASGPVTGALFGEDGWRYGGDEILRSPYGWHGVRDYQRMYHTPAVGSSFNALRAGVLSGGIGLLPAIKPVVGLGNPGQQNGTGLEAELSVEIADSNRRMLDAWETPADLVAWEMMEAMYLGHVMAEIGAERVLGGPDKGKLGITELRTLPRWKYEFLVDDAGKVARIGASTINDGWQEFETDHFAWLTWDPYRGDPRGRSCFRLAHYHWKMLMDLWPEVYKGWKQFGVPMTYGTTAPGAVPQTETNRDGTPKAGGKPVSAEHAMTLAMMQMYNGSRIAGPNGSDIKVIESTKDSSVVSGAVTILESQIIRSILLQMRATTEAQHGSKADSETGQDIMGTLIRFVRKWLERFFRMVLMRQNAWNYKADVARRLTPLVTLGDHEHQDFAANAAGVGVLYQAAYFTKSQLPYVDTFLGLPQRQLDDERIGPNGIVPDTPPEPTAPPAPAQGVGA